MRVNYPVNVEIDPSTTPTYTHLELIPRLNYSDLSGYSTTFTLGAARLSGSRFIYVSAEGSDTDNATELQDAYDLAATLSPTSSSRITIVAAPGYYDFGSNTFDMDTQYIDLVSLDGNRSVVFNSTSSGTINISASDVFVKGVDVGTMNFTVGDNLSALKLENCAGGSGSFGAGVTANGTFTNCTGGANAFAGSNGTASGTFVNCEGGAGSYAGGGGTASGTFTDCISGDDSFAGGAGTASGTFTRCTAGSGSFAGSGGTLSGKLYYCRLTSGTFPTVSGGKTRLCIDGNDAENNQ